uniref:Uncharacterized protein n=1 Tax=Arundo donax TaxID=35708 RepID=A0A0A9BZI9_ARUDO
MPPFLFDVYTSAHLLRKNTIKQCPVKIIYHPNHPYGPINKTILVL